MRNLTLITILLIATTATAQTRRRVATPPPPQPSMNISDSFTTGDRGWQPIFFDYSPLSADMNLDASIRPLPPEIGTGLGYRVTGSNRSDDLFMLLAKKLTVADGIVPNQRYGVAFRIVVASNAGSGCGGIGGAPGESVMLKAGASGTEPRIALDVGNHWRINLDVGNQIKGGRDMSAVTSIANGSPICSGSAPFVTLVRDHQHPTVVTASPSGYLWLLVGTDSGFEGITTLYYQSIDAVLAPSP
jgi:hypothetical protein